MGIKTPLKRVKGLGSAHEGTHHFIWQRITALALTPLTIWLIAGLLCHVVGSEAGEIGAWMEKPMVAVGLAIFMLAGLYHAMLGMQVIIEDYVHCPVKKLTLLLANKFVLIAAMVMSVLAIAKIHFTGIAL